MQGFFLFGGIVKTNGTDFANFNSRKGDTRQKNE